MKKTLLALGLSLVLGSAHAADGVTPAQFKALEARMTQLEAEAKAARREAADARAQAVAAHAELARLKGAAPAVDAVPPADDAPAPTAPTDDLAAADDLAAPEVPAKPRPSALAASNDALASSGDRAARTRTRSTRPSAIILNGSYSHHSLDPAHYARAGFPLVGEGGPSPQGFSLGESEMSLAANIDEKFYGQLTLTAESEDGQDKIGVEEAFIDTTALPAGWNVRLGRFYSNIGYLNSHHAHTDNFFDRPLPYQAFLGGQYGDDGVQVRWVAPTVVLPRTRRRSIPRRALPRRRGAGTAASARKTLFAHVGGDARRRHRMARRRLDAALQRDVGRGWLQRRRHALHRRRHVEVGAAGQLQGRRRHLARRVLPRPPRRHVRRSGRSHVASTGKASGAARMSKRVYRLNRQLGRRLPLSTTVGGERRPAGGRMPTPRAIARKLTWRNSEFSLFRLQLSRDKPNAADTDNAVTVQYQTSLGAHGAHKF